NIPPTYSPTLEQWMHLSSPSWNFYAEDVFLEINFQRDSKRMNTNEPGAYLFSFTVYSNVEEAKANFFGDDRDHWQDLWVDKIKAMKKERYAKEKELIQR